MKTGLIFLKFVSMIAIFVAGCAPQGILRKSRELLVPQEERLGAIAVQHWLEPSTTVDLAPNKTNTLAAALSETRNLANASAKRKLSQLAQEGNIGQERANFQENCVMLVRRNQRFYFPTSLLALPEIAGLPLRPNDVVLTLPMKQTIFSKQPSFDGNLDNGLREAGMQTINVVNQAGETVQTVQLKDDLSISNFLDPFASPIKYDNVGPEVSLSLVSRQEGAIIHHLVLPTVNSETSVQGAIYEEDFVNYVSLQLLNSQVEFRNQDVIQLTQLALFVSLF